MYSVDDFRWWGKREHRFVLKIQMVSLFPLFNVVNAVPILFIIMTKLLIYLSVRRNILRKISGLSVAYMGILKKEKFPIDMEENFISISICTFSETDGNS